jgi:hypothetical protein
MTSTTDGNCFLDSDGGSDEETFESFGEHEATGDRLLQQCISQSVVNNGLILTEPSMESSYVDGLEPYTGMTFPSLDDARDSVVNMPSGQVSPYEQIGLDIH